MVMVEQRHEVGGRPVYTREDLTRRRQVSLSYLEDLYRARATNGHPEAVGKVGRALVWDGESWDRWYDQLTSTEGLLTLEDIAARRGVSVSTAHAWWSDRAATGHPEAVKKLGRTLYFSAEQHDRWQPPRASDQSPRNRAGDPDELITLAEFARICGMEPTSITRYPDRPPAGFPDPVEVEELPGGTLRRRYTRRQAWSYDDHRGRHGGGRPSGPRVERRYPYDGDPRLQAARRALRDTPPEQHRGLARRLAEEHGQGSAGTWANILSAARHHPDDDTAPADPSPEAQQL
jgi:hypothetical protein